MKKKIDLFLDCGAFTAYKTNKPIDLQSYISFAKTNGKYFSVVANLDDKRSAETTLQNQKEMEKHGVFPIPVFHFGEDMKYLKQYVEKYDYIALGGLRKASVFLQKWLDTIFSEYFTDKNGRTKVRVHGFGLTEMPLVYRYPWYSVDSFTPNIRAAWGGIYLPYIRKGEFDYRELIDCTVSEQGKHKVGNSSNWSALPKSHQKQWVELIESQGFTFGKVHYQKQVPRRGKTEDSLPKNQLFNIIEEEPNKKSVAGDWVERMRWNLFVWSEMKKHMPVHKFHIDGETFKQPTKLYIGASSPVMLKAVSEHRKFDMLVSFAYFNKEDKKLQMLRALNK